MRDWTWIDEVTVGAMFSAIFLEFVLRAFVDVVNHRAGRPVHSFLWFGVWGDWKEFRQVIEAESDRRRRNRYMAILCVHYICLGVLAAAVTAIVLRHWR